MKKVLLATSLLTLVVGCSHNEHANQSTGPAVTRNAVANLISSDKKLKGVIEFTENNGEVLVVTKVDGLTTGAHGFHIHETGDCSKVDFTSAGGHFNPEKTNHGALHAEPSHAGDLGNLVADKNMKAYTTIKTHGVTLGEGKNSIIGKAVIIHKDTDDYTTQPTGNAGGRIACGVIELK
jgi:Cu-Zn family superoxide dismutase